MTEVVYTFDEIVASAYRLRKYTNQDHEDALRRAMLKVDKHAREVPRLPESKFENCGRSPNGVAHIGNLKEKAEELRMSVMRAVADGYTMVNAIAAHVGRNPSTIGPVCTKLVERGWLRMRHDKIPRPNGGAGLVKVFTLTAAGRERL